MQPTHYTVKDGTMTVPGGKPQKFPRHRDGAREATMMARRAAKGGPASGLRQTVNVLVTLNPDGFETWHSIVDPVEAMAEDLAGAKTAAQVKRLSARDDAQVVKDHTVAVRVQKVKDPMSHRGKAVPAGSVVVVDPARDIFIYTAEEVRGLYAPTPGNVPARSKK